MTNFWVSTKIRSVLAKKIFSLKIKLFTTLWYLWLQKLVGQKKLPPPPLLVLLLDPRSGIRDPWWIKIRIRDKHPGSVTLLGGLTKVAWEGLTNEEGAVVCSHLLRLGWPLIASGQENPVTWWRWPAQLRVPAISRDSSPPLLVLLSG